jgi:3-deoxy-manno-octulosonate cytidylyltransferase (CMP-KDO synthetase)
MKITGIIPARYNSSRFPGKPLVNINGKTMIRRVYEQCMKCPALNDVIVATDDALIKAEVESFGGVVVMTSPEHINGTERCNEVAQSLDSDVIINIQGDEPYIHPEQITLVAESFKNTEVQISSLAKLMESYEDLFTASIIKVVFDRNYSALYFSRNCIPHVRGVMEAEYLQYHNFYRHIGIYGYRKEILKQLVKLSPTTLEKAESLEQLRWLENGYKIHISLTEHDSISIDTPEDLDKVQEMNFKD